MGAIVRVSVVPERSGRHHLTVETDKAWYALSTLPNPSASDLLKIIAIELIHIANGLEGGEQKYD